MAEQNPFGNGNGGARGANAPPNNFLTNPSAGTPSGGPGMLSQSRPQKTGGDPDINPASIPAGGPLPFPASATPDPGNPLGTGSLGNGGKPFKLGA